MLLEIGVSVQVLQNRLFKSIPVSWNLRNDFLTLLFWTMLQLLSMFVSLHFLAHFPFCSFHSLFVFQALDFASNSNSGLRFLLCILSNSPQQSSYFSPQSMSAFLRRPSDKTVTFPVQMKQHDTCHIDPLCLYCHYNIRKWCYWQNCKQKQVLVRVRDESSCTHCWQDANWYN